MVDMIMKIHLYYLFLLIPLANSGNFISAKPKTTVDRILIINSFDENAKKWRNNKKELFNDLSIRVKQVLSKKCKGIKIRVRDSLPCQQHLPGLFYFSFS